MENEGQKDITISMALYRRLIADQKFLRHLEALGVDNWEGYCGMGSDDDEEEDISDAK